jgi:hypothetical protein
MLMLCNKILHMCMDTPLPRVASVDILKPVFAELSTTLHMIFHASFMVSAKYYIDLLSS